MVDPAATPPKETAVPSTSPVAIAPWVWGLPWVLILLTAPLWLHWWEPQMFVYLNTLCAPVAAPVWTGLSLLGNGWGVLGVTAPLLVLAPRLMWAWLCAAPFAVVLARSLKSLLESPRPAAMVDNAQMRIVGESLHNVAMPSGHTLTAFAVASAMFFAIPAKRRLRFAWLWLLAAGTGLSRIAVGAHWPGDVAVGAALGIWCGMLGQLLLVRLSPKHLLPTAWSLRLVAVLLFLALYHLLAEELDFAENLPFQYALALVVVGSLVAFGWQNIKSKRGH